MPISLPTRPGGASSSVGAPERAGAAAVLRARPPGGRVRRVSSGQGDGTLLELAVAGDPRAFELLFRRHRDGVHTYARRMLGDHSRADDVVQEVFVSAARAIADGRRPDHLRPWLHEIARRSCIDQWRRDQRRAEVGYAGDDGEPPSGERSTADGDLVLGAAMERESIGFLRTAFGDLTKLQHDVLVQRELEGRSTTEIAGRLGIDPGAVEGQLARGRRALRAAYRDLESGERCRAVRSLCEAPSIAALGSRDRRRASVHLRTCEACRRHAHAAGVDVAAFAPPGLAGVALLLPLPLLRHVFAGEIGRASEAAGGALGGKVVVGVLIAAIGGGGGMAALEVAPNTHPASVVHGVPTVVSESAENRAPRSASALVVGPATTTRGAVGSSSAGRAGAAAWARTHGRDPVETAATTGDGGPTPPSGGSAADPGGSAPLIAAGDAPAQAPMSARRPTPATSTAAESPPARAPQGTLAATGQSVVGAVPGVLGHVPATLAGLPLVGEATKHIMPTATAVVSSAVDGVAAALAHKRTGAGSATGAVDGN